MSAADALELLLDPASRVVGRVTVPEGLTVAQTLETLAEGTDIPLEQYQAAAKDVGALGPARLRAGPARGLPVPGDLRRRARARRRPQVLTQMVDRFEQAAETVDLVAGAERARLHAVRDRHRREPHRARGRARTTSTRKVARVVYNRLEQEIPLGIDASVLYGVGKTAGGEVTAERPGGRDAVREPPPAPGCRRRRSPRPARRPCEGALDPGRRRHPLLRAGLQGRHDRSSPTTTRSSSTSATGRAPRASSEPRAARPSSAARSRTRCRPRLHRAAYAALGLRLDVRRRRLRRGRPAGAARRPRRRRGPGCR